MLFNSFPFIFGFLPVVFAGFFAAARLGPRAAAGWLAAASLFFYAWWNPAALPLLLVSIAMNDWFGLRVSPASGASERARRAWLRFAIVIDLLVLAVFKYGDFAIDNANAVLTLTPGRHHFEPLGVVLPLGISFFTFTQIAFLVDSWKGLVRERNRLHYLLFVSYFPHLIAGPILHPRQVMPQFADRNTYRVHPRMIATGLCVFALGLAKKMLLADPLSGYADVLFAGVQRGATPMVALSWIGALAFTFQAYFDFSGYSDMAVGLSLLFGVRLPFNFNSPLRATSLIDLWTRWHMTLSAFLRDYIYFPLGGNRRGPVRRYLNLFVTMVIGGLWHGAAWTYAVWGAAHGALLAVNNLWRDATGGATDRPTRSRALAGWALTFLAFCLTNVFFRAPSLAAAGAIFRGLSGLNGLAVPEGLPPFLTHLLPAGAPVGIWQGLHQPDRILPVFLFAAAAAIAFAPWNTNALVTACLSEGESAQPAHRFFLDHPRAAYAGSLLLGAACAFMFLVSVGFLDRPRPFIYFQF
jgi:alginate O-acetyltransferase complex protein AlgI